MQTRHAVAYLSIYFPSCSLWFHFARETIFLIWLQNTTWRPQKLKQTNKKITQRRYGINYDKFETQQSGNLTSEVWSKFNLFLQQGQLFVVVSLFCSFIAHGLKSTACVKTIQQLYACAALRHNSTAKGYLWSTSSAVWLMKPNRDNGEWNLN